MLGSYIMKRNVQAVIKGSSWPISLKAEVSLRLIKDQPPSDRLDWGVEEIQLAHLIDHSCEAKSETLEGYAYIIAKAAAKQFSNFDVKVTVSRQGYDWEAESEVILVSRPPLQ